MSTAFQDPIVSDQVAKYGAASKYDFDNPQKWHTEASVPLLDEHQMTNEAGQPVANVDARVLQVIAENNNRRVRETGDPATLILGHTSDDPNAPEKPAKGFVVNYSVKPYKRDPKTGQVVYAIHGDFKVRPQNARMLEEYPRRSVELWWHKKEIDPIALLGGTAPERDLGVTVKNARLNHISLDKVPTDPRIREAQRRAENVLQFSMRGEWVIENYNSPRRLSKETAHEKGKVHKVMSEFKHGELHSGSKHGPKVTSREQATAIAMSEAGISKPKKHAHEECSMDHPKKYEDETEEPEKYDAGFDGGSTGDDLNQYDGGDEMPDSEGMEPDAAETDPVLAKVFQSKQWKELSDKLDMILQAIEGGPGGPEGEMGGGPPMGEEPGIDEMPPTEGPGAPMGGDGMEPPPEEMGHEGPDEEDTREAHGEKPVQFMGATGLPGPRNTFIPTTGKRYSRKGEPMTRTKPQKNPEVVALQKQLSEFKLKYARSEAMHRLDEAEAAGIIFGQNPEESQQYKEQEADYQAYLEVYGSNNGKEDVEYRMNEILTKYQRKRPNPAAPASIGLARFARMPESKNGSGTENEENWEPTNAMEATAYADLITETQMGGKGLSRTEAIKFMRKNRERYSKYDDDVHGDSNS